MIVEADNFSDGSRLWSVVGNFVFLLSSNRLAASQSHQRVAVSRRHVDPAFFSRTAEQFFDTVPRPLWREFGPARKDTRDSCIRNRHATVFKTQAKRLNQLWRSKHAFDVVVGGQDRNGLINTVLFVFLKMFHPTLLDQLHHPARIEIDAKADPAPNLSQMLNGQS